MKSPRHINRYLGLITVLVWSSLVFGETAGTLAVSPTSLTFTAISSGSAPAAQTISVGAGKSTRFSAVASVQSGGTNWLSISPSGVLTGSQTLAVTVNPSQLAAGTYTGMVNLANRGTLTAYASRSRWPIPQARL